MARPGTLVVVIFIIETGCTCHGGGAPSTEVVVSVSGVPRAYNESENVRICDQPPTRFQRRRWLPVFGTVVLELTPGEGSKTVDDEPGALSQSEPGNDWVVQWTAPSEDAGPANFQLVGNAVDGDGAPNEDDKWNILTFTVSAPGATEVATDEDVSLRTISVGDYDSLFVAEEDPRRSKQNVKRVSPMTSFQTATSTTGRPFPRSSSPPSFKASSTNGSLVAGQRIWTRASLSLKACDEGSSPQPLPFCSLTSLTADNRGATDSWQEC